MSLKLNSTALVVMAAEAMEEVREAFKAALRVSYREYTTNFTFIVTARPDAAINQSCSAAVLSQL